MVKFLANAALGVCAVVVLYLAAMVGLERQIQAENSRDWNCVYYSSEINSHYGADVCVGVKG